MTSHAIQDFLDFNNAFTEDDDIVVPHLDFPNEI
jgi:hypothetical protein